LFCIGIIGAGMVADMHIEAIITDSRAYVKWVSSTTISKNLLRIKEKFDIPRITDNYFDILEDREVDAVIICSPPDSHAKYIHDIIPYGKHILAEKPLCISQEDLDELSKIESAPSQVIMECSARFSLLNKKFKLVKEIITDKLLGEIYFIHHVSLNRQSRPGIEYNPDAKWFLDKSKAGGGPLFDWGEYDLAFHLGILTSEPTLKSWEVTRLKGLDNFAKDAPIFDIEEHSIALMEFDSGLKYYYEIANNAHNDAPCETRIYGTRGGLKLHYKPWDSNDIELYFLDDDEKAQQQTISIVSENEPSPDEQLITHFLDCCIDGKTPLMPFSLAAKHLEIVFNLSSSNLTKIT